MNDFAAAQLLQARSYVKAGNLPKAMESLEKARVLVRDNVALQSEVLGELESVYRQAGRAADADRAREQRIGLKKSTAADPVASAAKASPPLTTSAPILPHRAIPTSLPPSVRRQRAEWRRYMIPAVTGLVVCVIAIVFALVHSSGGKNNPPVVEAAPTPDPKSAPVPTLAPVPALSPAPTSEPAPRTPTPAPPTTAPLATPTPPRTAPPPITSTIVANNASPTPVTSVAPRTQAPATSPVAIATPRVDTPAPPRPPAASEPAPDSDFAPTSIFAPPAAPKVATPPAPGGKTSNLDRQQLLKETVGLCLLVAHYQGLVNDEDVAIDVPLGMGTAFGISTTGLMLTNRHVVEGSKDEKLPDNLAKAKLPSVTFRGISYFISFGPDAKDRFPAKVLHRSEQYDMALMKIDRRITHPLIFAPQPPRQGDDVLVCGFPGIVTAMLNNASNTPNRITDRVKKWHKSHRVDAFDDFSDDSFDSTLTRGIVSAPSRNVDGVHWVQMDAAISPGNSGGPVLNLENQVVGIATWAIRSTAPGQGNSNYNFALSVGQLNEELAPYLRK